MCTPLASVLHLFVSFLQIHTFRNTFLITGQRTTRAQRKMHFKLSPNLKILKNQITNLMCPNPSLRYNTKCQFLITRFWGRSVFHRFKESTDGINHVCIPTLSDVVSRVVVVGMCGVCPLVKTSSSSRKEVVTRPRSDEAPLRSIGSGTVVLTQSAASCCCRESWVPRVDHPCAKKILFFLRFFMFW